MCLCRRAGRVAEPCDKTSSEGQLGYNSFHSSFTLWLPFHVQKQKLNGVFCIYCTMFAANDVGRAKVQTGVFVHAPFRRYTHWSTEVAEHFSRGYHTDSATKAEAFITSMKNPNKDITVQLDAAAGRQVNENRQVLVPIIESVSE